jgi:hypothetical protein
VFEVAGCERDPDLFGGGRYRKIRQIDAGVALPPFSAELSGAARDRFVDGNPVNHGEQPSCRTSFRGAEALDDLDSAHLGARGPTAEAGDELASSLRSTKDID